MARAATLNRTADRLHSAAIHLLRRVRASDVETGLSPARLSLLSVLVFGSARTPSELAAAEQVRLPTISGLVAGLEAEGLVRRGPHPADRRAVRITATAKGRRLLHRGRARRLENLVELLEPLSSAELATLADAAEILEGAISERGRGRAG
jgi:DNA-binding MarR family transcriptional regulator